MSEETPEQRALFRRLEARVDAMVGQLAELLLDEAYRTANAVIPIGDAPFEVAEEDMQRAEHRKLKERDRVASRRAAEGGTTKFERARLNDSAVLAALRETPGVTMVEIRRRLALPGNVALTAANRLLAAGKVRREGARNATRWYPTK
jgi:hypothetical protein